MRYEVKFTTQFKKDIKLAKKQKSGWRKIKLILNKINDRVLPGM